MPSLLFGKPALGCSRWGARDKALSGVGDTILRSRDQGLASRRPALGTENCFLNESSALGSRVLAVCFPNPKAGYVSVGDCWSKGVECQGAEGLEPWGMPPFCQAPCCLFSP